MLEDEDLLLPSSLNQPTRTALGLDGLATIEYQLREGHAHDALADLRLAIKTYNANVKFKQEFVWHQRANT